MSVKCWNCGAENPDANGYCISCASTLTHYQKSEPLDVHTGVVLARSLSHVLLRAACGALMRAIAMIGVIAAIFLTYDLLTGDTSIAGLDEFLVFFGLFLIVIFSFNNIRTPQKTGVVSRYQERRDRSTRAVHAHPAFWPVWMVAQRRPYPDRYSQQLIPLLVGLDVFLVGGLLML